MFEMTRQEQAIVVLVLLALIVGAAVRSHAALSYSRQPATAESSYR